jgi:hypothetical protein
MIDAFEAQAVANTMHIMAKTHYSPWDPSLVPALEVRAEALEDTFNTQRWQTRCGRMRRWGGSPGLD